MRRKSFRAIDAVCAIVAVLFAFIIGVFLKDLTDRAPQDTPPVPTTIAGCTTAISFVINEDGSVTTTCPLGSE